jgi:transposase
MKVTTIGLDIAKNPFQVHGVDENGKVVVRKALKRDKVAEFFAHISPCDIPVAYSGEHEH